MNPLHRPFIRRGLVIVLLAVFSVSCHAQTFSDHPEAMDAGDALPLISVEGNRFVDENGETFVFRGLALSDPAALLERGHWGRRYFEEGRKWGANVVRVPVHPEHWNALGQRRYLELLDEAVQWAGELGMYVIIDWHTIGNMLTGVYHLPMYITSKDETFRFWHTIAQRYRHNPTVACYELYNEPTNRNGQFGRMDWRDYKALIEDLIHMIYAIDDTAIPLVAGYNWGYDLSNVRREPIGMPGVAYVTHPYPQKRRDNWEENWERDWGFVAAKYPMVATEFGFMSADGPGAHIPVIGDETYGEAIISFFEERGISWTPWVFDASWSPQLISNWDYEPTRQGRFFRQKMLELNGAP